MLVAGATGNLGGKIVQTLVKLGADVRVVVRASTDPEKITALRKMGVTVFKVDMLDIDAVSAACQGGTAWFLRFPGCAR